ncbi:uncharacterized protein LOC144884688 [Branchiostoma floridae x Branchiostoma japonicum]
MPEKQGAQKSHSEANHRPLAARNNTEIPPKETMTTNLQNKETQLDILILGDSNTKALKTDVLYPSKSVNKELAFNISQCLDYIQSSARPDPKVILFHVGTDDIRDARDATFVTENFRELIQVTHEKYPRTNLVISSVLPRDDPTLQRFGDDVNTFLKVTADETSYIHTIDNSNFAASGSIKRPLYSSDGYHLNRNGTRVLAANIKRTINPLVGLGHYMGRRNDPINNNQPTANIKLSSPNRSYRDAVVGAQMGRPSQTPPRFQPPSRSQPAPRPTQPPTRSQPAPTSSHHPVHGQERPAPAPEKGQTESMPVISTEPSTQRTGQTFDEPRVSGPMTMQGSKSSTTNGQTGEAAITPRHRAGPCNQPPPSGPWSRPMFQPPPVPWGPPPTNANFPIPPRHPPPMNPPPWPWHPSMMWPPMFAMW